MDKIAWAKVNDVDLIDDLRELRPHTMPAKRVLAALRRPRTCVVVAVRIAHGSEPVLVDITAAKAERIVKRSGHALVACEIRPNGLVVLGT